MFATPCWLSQWLVVETAGTASALSWSVLVGDLPLASGALTILFSHDLGCGGIYKMVVMLRSCWPGAHIFLVFIQITIVWWGCLGPGAQWNGGPQTGHTLCGSWLSAGSATN